MRSNCGPCQENKPSSCRPWSLFMAFWLPDSNSINKDPDHQLASITCHASRASHWTEAPPMRDMSETYLVVIRQQDQAFERVNEICIDCNDKRGATNPQRVRNVAASVSIASVLQECWPQWQSCSSCIAFWKWDYGLHPKSCISQYWSQIWIIWICSQSRMNKSQDGPLQKVWLIR